MPYCLMMRSQSAWCQEATHIVKNSSGPNPHMVTAKKTGQYACDSECPNWKSLGVCVAAAEEMWGYFYHSVKP